MTSIAHCQKITNESAVKCEERGRKAVITNESQSTIIKTRFDGCVVTGQLAADYIVTDVDVGDVIIELKGKNVEHAMKQVEATAHYWKEKGHCCGNLAALIVGTQYPRADTAARKAQERFARIHGRPLHVVTKNFAGRLDWILSFKGPHRA